MKFYKLELINREHSYNAMFGTTPNVGYLNPIQKGAGAPQMGIGGMGVGGMGVGGMGVAGKGKPAPPNMMSSKDIARKKSQLV